jgi:hypothetical protein
MHTASTEVPAERIAGDLALAEREGAVPLPSAKQLEAVYQVPPATVSAALGRLDGSWPPGGGAAQGRHAGTWTLLLAAAAMCRRIEAFADNRPAELVEVLGQEALASAGEFARLQREQFLVAARRRRAAEGDQLAARAKQVLDMGARLTVLRGGPRVHFPWALDPGTVPSPAAPPPAAPGAPRAAGAGGLALELLPGRRPGDCCRQGVRPQVPPSLRCAALRNFPPGLLPGEGDGNAGGRGPAPVCPHCLHGRPPDFVTARATRSEQSHSWAGRRGAEVSLQTP